MSLYIHIPFCKRKCFYCDFPSYANSANLYEPYVKALIQELIQKSSKLKGYTIKTIFFGGGTPTVLSPKLIKNIMDIIFSKYDVSSCCEITIESNPGTLSFEMLYELKKMGFNRLSIGVQAWQNHLLKQLGRIHTIEEFLENYDTARKVGFENISTDLMFALPNQTLFEWEETLKNIIKLEPEHISAYSLIIEPETPFQKWYEEKKFKLPSETLDRNMYTITQELLKQSGYHRYEISNFAKMGKESQHNQVYWKTEEYIGFGLGAHSFWKKTRYHNSYQIETYLTNQNNFEKQKEDIENLTLSQQYAEFMFMGLRMMEGISEETFFKRFGKKIEDIYHHELQQLMQDSLLIQENNRIRLTDRGIDISNYVFEKFIQ